jgi:hypothetical protein
MHRNPDNATIIMWDGEVCCCGPVFESKPLLPELWRHWQKCDGKPEPTGKLTLTNMSDDPRCIDRRWITDDPETWTAPKTKDVD